MTDDLEANLLRDKKATLCASVSDMVERLQGDRDSLAYTCDELVRLPCCSSLEGSRLLMG
jgi:hypothetical protein